MYPLPTHQTPQLDYVFFFFIYGVSSLKAR